MTGSQNNICERDLITAYIDGELDADVTTLFEQHLESCADCRTQLREHRLFVCELDAALNSNTEIPVPANFSKMIAARASSDMRGVRTRSEHKRALSICAILGLTGFALIGATARDALFLVAGKLVMTVLSIGGFLLNLVYDAVAGLVVISRVLGRRIVTETGSLGVVLLLGVAILILSRLISDYHRTGATE
jgi:hypothetical protein